MLAMQRATSELESHVRTERRVIEAALKSAKLHMRVQTRRGDPTYRAIQERISGAGASTAAATEFTASPIPSFEGMSRHPDPEVERTVRSKFASLKADRDTFLSTVHAQLSSDPALCGHFEES